MKKYLIGFVFGLVIAGSIGVLATVAASSITYNGTTVDLALDDLYSRVNSTGSKTCLYLSGTKNEVGAKYVCDPGDGVARNFYILKVNTNDVELIMDRNISDTVGANTTMSWADAKAFFTTGAGKDLSWTNVISVDLPGAQEIADAGGITNWDVTTASISDASFFGTHGKSDTSKRNNYAWLYNYTRICKSKGNCDIEYPDSNIYPNGYWTKDLILDDSLTSWAVGRMGVLDWTETTDSQYTGVRPVIKVAKSKLSD